MHSLTNPHALVRITYFDGDEQDGNLANSAIEEISEIYQPTVEAGKSWGKFMPGDFSRIDTFRRREANSFLGLKFANHMQEPFISF